MTPAARPPSFVNDLETCVGCHACVVACANENQLAPGTSWRHVVTFNDARRAGLPTFHLTLACNHCAKAPCLDACPARAISRDARTGAVLISDASCIGCRYCSWVCPYDAPRFDERAGVMHKCTLCAPRLDSGLAPACVVACPVGALSIGPVAEAEPAGVPGFPERAIGPSIRFLPLRGRSTSQGAVAAASGVVAQAARGAADHPTKISSRTEWSLVVFTLVAQFLVGLVLGGVAGGASVRLPLLVGPGFAAIGISTMHLGRPLRAWRAAVNLQTSWLSREVVSWSVFLGLASLHVAVHERVPALGWASAAVGLVCLTAIDRVYAVMARHARTRLDDVSAVTGGLFVASLAAGSLWMAVVVALWRISAFRRRVFASRRTALLAGGISFVRTALTAVGLGLIAQDSAVAVGIGLASTGAAELLDRIVFYDTLDLQTPRSQMARDVAAVLRRA